MTRAQNLARVPDLFSTIGQTYINRAKQLTLGSDLNRRMSREGREAIHAAAKEADKWRKKQGGDWGSLAAPQDVREKYAAAQQRFYRAVEDEARRQGFDGFVYGNRVEGKGDSIAVFDPSQIRSIHAAFDPARRASPDLLAGIAPPLTAGAVSGLGAGAAVYPWPYAAQDDERARDRQP